MKIDLHVHAKERSGCSGASEEELIKAAIAAGLDAFVFTDHQRIIPTSRVEELNARFAPFLVLAGVEIWTDCGDVLVYGVRCPELEQGGWTYAAVRRLTRERGGYAILAHPFRGGSTMPEPIVADPPDGMEIHSIHTPPGAEQMIRDFAAAKGVKLFSDSDAHSIDPLGRYYNEIDARIANESDLVAALRDLPVTLRRATA